MVVGPPTINPIINPPNINPIITPIVLTINPSINTIVNLTNTYQWPLLMQWQKWDTTTEINAEQLKRCGPPRWRTMMQSAQSHKLEPGQTGTGNDWCIYIYKVYTWPIYLSIQPSIYQSICSSNPIQSTCLDYGQHRFKHPSMTFSLDIYIYIYILSRYAIWNIMYDAEDCDDEWLLSGLEGILFSNKLVRGLLWGRTDDWSPWLIWLTSTDHWLWNLYVTWVTWLQT